MPATMTRQAWVKLVIDCAHYYAEHTMIPIPMFGLVINAQGVASCSCRNPGCKSPGKHPNLQSGEKEGITSPEIGVAKVIAAAKADPYLNLAILLGPSGLVAVDLDVKTLPDGTVSSGPDNFAALLTLISGRLNIRPEHAFPETPAQQSGGGGQHFFYRTPIDSTIKTRDLGNSTEFNGKQIEFKAGSANVNVYPSLHISGGRYIPDPPPSADLMPTKCPDWILAMCRESSQGGTAGDQDIVVPLDELKKFAKKAISASSGKGGTKFHTGSVLKALLDFDASKEPSCEAVNQLVPLGRAYDTLQGVMWALADAYVTIRAENVLSAIRPAIDWRVSRGSTTTFDSLVAMLRSAQNRNLSRRRSWERGLVKLENGKLQQCESNVFRYLAYHPDWEGVLGYDERSDMPVLLKRPPYHESRDAEDEYPRPLREDESIRIADWFALKLGSAMSTGHIDKALPSAAKLRIIFDPVKQYFESLAWDGVPRLHRWLHDYAGAEDSVYTQRVGATYLISAVARTYRPGCKVDHVLVFEARQGFKKGMLLGALCPNRSWISNSHIDIDTKEGYLQLAAKVFIDFNELSSIKKKDVTKVKNFMTGDVDTYRNPYAKRIGDVPRRSVFSASTNDSHYLTDPTGNRRFWPVACRGEDSRRDLALAEVRDQIWAEAVHRFKTPNEDTSYNDPAYTEGEVWWLKPEEEELAKIEQAAREDILEDPWLEQLEEALELSTWVDKEPDGWVAAVDAPRNIFVVRGFVRTSRLFEALGVPVERRSSIVGQRVKRIMEHLECLPEEKRTKAISGRGYLIADRFRSDREAVTPPVEGDESSHSR